MGVHQSVVIVEHHDGGHNTGGHHEHDAVEVGTWLAMIVGLMNYIV